MNSVSALRPAYPLAHDAIRGTKMPVLTQVTSRRRADESQFSVVYLVTFPVFLLTAVVRRLLPGRRPAGSGLSGESLSVIREAKASAQTCGSFSLMG